MSKVNITSIKFEGIGSYSTDTTFKFGKYGLFCITGENGAGKSTILTALYWGLYKLTLADWAASQISSMPHVREKGYRGTRVIVQFTVGKTRYLVARHLNYRAKTLGIVGESSLMIFAKPAKSTDPWAGEHMVGDELYKGDQQGFINKALGIDAKTFVNAIVFGQKLNRLVGASGKEKRELFESFFDLDWTQAARENAEAKKKEIEKEVLECETQQERARAILMALEDKIRDRNTALEQWESERDMRLDDIRAEHTLSKNKKAKLTGEREALEEVRKAKRKTTKTITQEEVDQLFYAVDTIKEKLHAAQAISTSYNRDIKDIDKDVLRASQDAQAAGIAFREVTETCTYCGGKLDAKKIKTLKETQEVKRKEAHSKELNLSHERGKIVDKLNANEIQVALIKAQFDTAHTAYEEGKKLKNASIDKAGVEIERINAQLEVINEGLAAIKARYNKEKQSTPPKLSEEDLEAQLESLIEQSSVFAPKLERLKKELVRVEFWIKKGFGSSGVKSYVFSAMLQQLNEYVAEYSSYFGYGVKFWVNLAKESKPFETTIYRGEVDYDYKQLSGGQKQRIDLALAFAMFDMVCYKIDFNFVAFDEFAESLNQEGVAMVHEILRLKAQTKAVYVISHSPIFNPPGAQIIEVTGGITSPSIINQSA